MAAIEYFKYGEGSVSPSFGGIKYHQLTKFKSLNSHPISDSNFVEFPRARTQMQHISG